MVASSAAPTPASARVTEDASRVRPPSPLGAAPQPTVSGAHSQPSAPSWQAGAAASGSQPPSNGRKRMLQPTRAGAKVGLRTSAMVVLVRGQPAFGSNRGSDK